MNRLDTANDYAYYVKHMGNEMWSAGQDNTESVLLSPEYEDAIDRLGETADEVIMAHGQYMKVRDAFLCDGFGEMAIQMMSVEGGEEVFKLTVRSMAEKARDTVISEEEYSKKNLSIQPNPTIY